MKIDVGHVSVCHGHLNLIDLIISCVPSTNLDHVVAVVYFDEGGIDGSREPNDG